MTREQPDAALVKTLGALAQATRLRVFEVVAGAGEAGMPAGAIAREVQAPASTLSFHLKELSQAGLLEARPQGRFIYYAARREALEALKEFLGRCGAPVESGIGQKAKHRAKDRPPGRTKGEGQLSIFED
jgi:ArsR family transcriptional regulator, arsenate/arsenite/antimonite-responsive transcriptional repressor